MLNVTSIPSARVPFLDERTGLISREWFAFFQNLFTLTGGGSNDVSLLEVQFPPAPNPGDQQNPEPASLFEVPQPQIGVDPVLDPAIGLTVESLQSLLAATEAAAIAPAPSTPGLSVVTTDTTLTGSGTTLSPLGVALKSPVTIAADYTVLDTDKWIINNKTSACVLTLPVAATWPGRLITVQNYQAFAVTSASSNVVPQGGGAAGTAVLLGVVGNWAALVSNGTNWVIMQAAPNNILLLE
jgi:hypothetical protein